MNDRLPPQDISAEKAVLGACLVDYRKAVPRAAQHVHHADAFFHRPHGVIWEAIRRLDARAEPIDQLTLSSDLNRAKELEQVGGVVYLAELAGQVASAANVEYHAKIVAIKYALRRVIEIGQTMQHSAYDERDAAHIVSWASEELFKLFDGQQGGGFRAADEIMADVIEAAEKAAKSVSGLTGIDTGLSGLNGLTGGWQDSDFIVIGARPSIGKTALSTDFGRHAAVHSGIGVGIFNLEMAGVQAGQRLVAGHAGLSLHRLRTGQLSSAEMLSLCRGADELAQAPIYVDDSAGTAITEMRARARELKRRHGIGLIIVDYLQLASAPERGSSREQEVSRISRGCKGMAKELHVPVIGLSQLSRASEARADHRPQLSDLRESGSLEQDCDVAMFIYRPDVYGQKEADTATELLLRKQRNGPTGEVFVRFDPETATFHDRSY